MVDIGPAEGGTAPELPSQELPTPESQSPEERAAGRSKLGNMRAAGAATRERIEASAPRRYWSQLSAVDFMNSSLAFSALAVLCGFPFLAVVNAALGQDIRQTIVTRMGLSPAAARDVNALMSSGNRAVATLTVASAVLLLLGAVGMAGTLQVWYQRIYEQPPVKNLRKNLAYQLAGLVAFSVYIWIDVSILHAVKQAGAGAVFEFLLSFVLSTLFWWCSAYFLLYRRVGCWELLPAGVATGFCITGLGVFSALLFSDQVTSGDKTYGPAGVVVALISYLVGFGVCLHLGAVFGRMWNDWRRSAAPPSPRSPSSADG